MIKNKTQRLVTTGIFITLIIVGAFIKIPFLFVPITLQSLFTMAAGIFLGPVYGALTVLIYVIMGLLGIPVFTGGGGPAYVLQPTFGYLIGFIVSTYVIGLLVQNKVEKTFKVILSANIVGMFINYIFGVGYYVMMSKFYLGTPLDPKTLMIYFFLIFLPGDFFKCILAAVVGNRVLSSRRI